MKFLVEKWDDGQYHARTPSSPDWQVGTGDNAAEAIGDLIISFQHTLGISVEDGPPTPLDGLAACNVGETAVSQ